MARGLLLTVESGSARGQQAALGNRPLKLGAAGDNDLVLDDPTVSRHHAELTPTRGGALLRDLESRNGTRVNGERITAIGETHAVSRNFQELVFRVAAGPEQHLRTGSTERSFLDFGDHGDRLVVHVHHAPTVKLLLTGPTTRW